MKQDKAARLRDLCNALLILFYEEALKQANEWSSRVEKTALKNGEFTLTASPARGGHLYVRSGIGYFGNSSIKRLEMLVASISREFKGSFADTKMLYQNFNRNVIPTPDEKEWAEQVVADLSVPATSGHYQVTYEVTARFRCTVSGDYASQQIAESSMKENALGSSWVVAEDVTLYPSDLVVVSAKKCY